RTPAFHAGNTGSNPVGGATPPGRPAAGGHRLEECSSGTPHTPGPPGLANMRSSRCLDPTSPPGGGFTAPSGFPDFDAAETAARTAAIAAASAVVERYGFVRVETPLVE